jgi:hypothetical protein
MSTLSGYEYYALPRAASYAAALLQPPKLVVIHDTGNAGSDRYAEASYAASRTDSRSFWTSAHFYTDRGGVLGSLPTNLQAWAAYAYANANAFHVEICLRDKLDPTQLQHTAALVRRLCQQAGIPMRKLSPAEVGAGSRGICGHADITLGLGVGDHTDPGSDFPWPQFMALVNSSAGAAAPAGEDDVTYINGQIDRDCVLGAAGAKPFNINLGRVAAGADAKPAWLQFSNDTGADAPDSAGNVVTHDRYALRILGVKNGQDGNYTPLTWQNVVETRDSGNVVVFAKGRRGWCQLPTECTALTVYRVPLAEDSPAYSGSIGFAIER